MSASCRKCGGRPNNANIVLVRVNEKGVPGIWECSPACKVEFISSPAAIRHAIDLNNIEGEEEVVVGRVHLT